MVFACQPSGAVWLTGIAGAATMSMSWFPPPRETPVGAKASSSTAADSVNCWYSQMCTKPTVSAAATGLASLAGAVGLTGTTGVADALKGTRQGAIVLQTAAELANLIGAVGLTSTTGAGITTPSGFSTPGEPPDEEGVSPNAGKVH